ncbi:MAG: metallophosphoesterase, partial [Oscillospiraceae bacterium]|nr:metallophosphoesterase [Oscillospiraceae bacterium]
VAEREPQALLVTGDLFDDDRQNEAAAELLNSYVLRFPDGIWFCRGNHEYFRDFARTERALKKTAVHDLVNCARRVRGGDTPLYFAGVDYPTDRANFENLERAYAERALENIPQNAVTVLLAHHPDFIDDGARAGVALTLTGHTHGGQFGVLGYPIFPVFKYTRGMVRQGDSYGYVHVGNGSWFPIRIGCPPEIAFFTLRRKDS